MVARSQLEALDHNANNGRNHATVSTRENEEELRYKVVFPNRSTCKEWVAKPIIEKTIKDLLQPMLDAIVERKNQDAANTEPHIPRNIASTPRPDKAEVIARHTSRFSAS